MVLKFLPPLSLVPLSHYRRNPTTFQITEEKLINVSNMMEIKMCQNKKLLLMHFDVQTCCVYHDIKRDGIKDWVSRCIRMTQMQD